MLYIKLYMYRQKIAVSHADKKCFADNGVFLC